MESFYDANTVVMTLGYYLDLRDELKEIRNDECLDLVALDEIKEGKDEWC